MQLFAAAHTAVQCSIVTRGSSSGSSTVAAQPSRR